MIVGIGTDIVSIARMADSISAQGDKLAQRLLTPEELNEYLACKQQAAFLAKRFAAKEAAVKALGTGFSNGITWRQVFVSHNSLGAPQLNFREQAAAQAKTLGASRQHLSLSDEAEHAVAFVILESD